MTMDPILERVQALVTEVAGPERAPADADPDTPLGDSGYWLDSVDVLWILIAGAVGFFFPLLWLRDVRERRPQQPVLAKGGPGELQANR